MFKWFKEEFKEQIHIWVIRDADKTLQIDAKLTFPRGGNQLYLTRQNPFASMGNNHFYLLIVFYHFQGYKIAQEQNKTKSWEEGENFV